MTSISLVKILTNCEIELICSIIEQNFSVSNQITSYFILSFLVSSLLYVTIRGIVSHLLLLHTSIYVKKLWLARIISDPEIRLRLLSRDIVLCSPLKTLCTTLNSEEMDTGEFFKET